MAAAGDEMQMELAALSPALQAARDSVFNFLKQELDQRMLKENPCLQTSRIT